MLENRISCEYSRAGWERGRFVRQPILIALVNDSGSGSVNVPSSLGMVERGEGDRGIWESATFATAAERILLKVESVGSGSIGVR